jgi:hypothetical protein
LPIIPPFFRHLPRPPTRHDFSAHKKDSVCIRQRSLKG